MLAADTEPALVEHLRHRAEQEGLANVVPILAVGRQPASARRASDVVLDRRHLAPHRRPRGRYARRLAAALKPADASRSSTGSELPVGSPLDHKLAREQVIDEMTQAGYRLAGEPDLLPYQYVLLFTPTAR